jgi:hypothetical protein
MCPQRAGPYDRSMGKLDAVPPDGTGPTFTEQF